MARDDTKSEVKELAKSHIISWKSIVCLALQTSLNSHRRYLTLLSSPLALFCVPLYSVPGSLSSSHAGSTLVAAYTSIHCHITIYPFSSFFLGCDGQYKGSNQILHISSLLMLYRTGRVNKGKLIV
ncbi:unnamed protein product [Thelazia callipaeda]|uniref:Ovule protein n=1 Tax=Thelazia callipaeda TaxID=103827 RepID=A0A0N5D9E0_THECL|nr:unnamed protein product [Thelazia callipaeda]